MCDCAMRNPSPCWVSSREGKRLDVRRDGIGRQRKTECARAARRAAFARPAHRAMVSSRAHSRRNRQQTGDNRRLLSPVMIFLRLWFGWRFCELTGEIFFARSPRASRARSAGATARKSAGLKSPVPKHQVFDSIESFALQNFSRKTQSAGTEAACPEATKACAIPVA